MTYSPVSPFRGEYEDGTTSITLIEAMQAVSGPVQRQALERFCFLYGPLVWAWCRKYKLQTHDEEDVTAVVILKVMGAIRRFHRRGKGSFRAWLASIIKNAICDVFRKQEEFRSIGDEELEQRIAAAERDDEVENEVTDMVWRLYMEFRETRGRRFDRRTLDAFEQVFLQGRSVADVAEALGKTPNAVRQGNSHVLKALREMARDHGIDELFHDENDPPSQ